MKLIAADVGQYEREVFVNDFLISPAERMVVQAYFEKPGSYQLISTKPDGQVELVRFLVTEEEASPSFVEEFNTLHTNQSVVDEFASFRSYQNMPPDKRLLLTVKIDPSGQVDHSAHAHGAGTDDGHDHGAAAVDHSAHAHAQAGDNRLAGIQWDDPGASDYRNTSEIIVWKLIDQDTGRESMDIPVADWTFTEGDLVKVRLTNDANADHVMQHPIHLHGQQFVVLSENGVPNTNFAWKDTVLVYPGEVVDILVDMSNLGEWMSHCHISEHLHAGMMMQFRVEDENGYATGDEFRASLPPGTGHEMPSADSSPAPAVIPSTVGLPEVRPFAFNDTDKVDTFYRVKSEIRSAKAGRLEDIVLTFEDVQGNAVNLNAEVDRAVTVTFMKSDNTNAFTTFPGNKVFPQPVAGSANDDHEHDDGHDHSHSSIWPLVQTAHAHGESITDGHHEGGIGREYSVPVQFPEKGVYRGFVEFMLENETETRVAYFDIEVTSNSFSVTDFGWNQIMIWKWTLQWWILLITSLVLMVPLVWVVRKYINVDKV